MAACKGQYDIKMGAGAGGEYSNVLSPTLYKCTFFQILSPNTFDFLLTQGV